MTARELAAPSPFVTEHLAAARPGVALDVACGRGRHALALARAGWRVEAIDRSFEACRELQQRAMLERLPIEVVCADLTRLRLPRRRYTVVVDTLYLDRSIVPALVGSLVTGGLLLFETFVVEQLATGHPRDPAFVLQPNELLHLVGSLRVRAFREGPIDRDGRTVHLASVAAEAVEVADRRA